MKSSVLGLMLLVSALAVAGVVGCTFSSTNTDATGLYYVVDLDYTGTDASATPNIADIRACYDHCTSERVGNPAIKYWSYDTNPANNKICWCKTSVSSSPTYFQYRAAGPLDSYSFYAPAGGNRRSACASQYEPIVSATNSQACGSDTITWSSTNAIGCTVYPCSFTKVDTTATGSWYLTGANWNGVDVATYSNIYSESACRDMCATVSGAIMWQLDTRPTGNHACTLDAAALSCFCLFS